MRQPCPHFDPIVRVSDALGLPRPRGWSARSLGWLTVWLVGNLGWIVGGVVTSLHLPGFRPPPGWAYWSLWCMGGGLAISGLTLALARRPIDGKLRWPLFVLLSLAMCIFEELLCYLTGTGMWEGRTRFLPEFGLGVGVLQGWSIGSGLVLRFSGLDVWEALLLCGLSGWLAEAFIVPRFIAAPLLLIWILPLSILSYWLLILPSLAVVGRQLPQPPEPRRARVRSYLAAILLPVGLWFGVAIVMSLLFKS